MVDTTEVAITVVMVAEDIDKEFPSLSWLAKTKIAARLGIKKLVRECSKTIRQDIDKARSSH